LKIAIHTNGLDQRGTGKVPGDYARALHAHTPHEAVIMASGLSSNEALARTNSEFRVFTYDKHVDTHRSELVRDVIEEIVEREKIDYVHMIKYGIDDHITPRNCRTGIHCVFNMTQPHGDVYAAVSETLALKFGHTKFVPHIITRMYATENVRAKYGIPMDAMVVGRAGGLHTFDLPFVHAAVFEALEKRPDLWFLFLSTEKFIEHPRAIFVPWLSNEQQKFNHIHSCDAMLHARAMGETFGLAIGEFSAANKPVLTWSGNDHPGYDRAHLDILGNKAIVYNSQHELVDLLLGLDRNFLCSLNWDVYTQRFSPKVVIQQYQDVFLKL